MNKKLTIENTRGLVDPCIYMLTAPNGKIYVGSSVQGFHLRSEAYRNERAHCAIGHALKKYGASNFTFSILESSKTWGTDKLIEREQFYLDILQPFKPRGYNVACVAGMVSPKNKRRISRFTRAGEPLASYESAKWASVVTGVCASSITACCKGQIASAGKDLWLYSKDITPQEVAKREELAADKKQEKPVSQYTRAGVLVKEYESAVQAARDTGIHASGVGACCRGRLPNSGGFIWLYSNKVTPQEIERRVERVANVVNTNKRGTSQYTRAGVLVASYPSTRQASKETGAHAGHITKCCKGKTPSAGGFLWIYSEEATPQEAARRVERSSRVVSLDMTQRRVRQYKTRGVSQYTRAGVLVASYPSIRQASKETGAHAGHITKCCKGKTPSAGGFLWIYSEEATPQEAARRVERSSRVVSLDMTQRRVRQYKTRGVSQYTRAGILVKDYLSGSQAARDTGVGNITTCCKGEKSSSGGFIWLYSKEVSNQEIARRVEQAARGLVSNKRNVSQYTCAGILVKDYLSGSQAARDTGVNASSITQCCKGKYKSAGGFIWKYTKEKPHAI